MQPANQHVTPTFRYQDPLSGAYYNPDGTNSQNPVISAGTQNVANVIYNLQKLSSSDSITFKGQNYKVYSAVPQNMTIASAYSNCSQYYSQPSLKNVDFTIPAKNQINYGLATGLATPLPPTAPTTSPYTKEKVYLTTPSKDTNSLYFIPNLPNSAGSHKGLTANIYFVGDPYIGKPGYWPDTSTYPNGSYHLTPYGWASDPAIVAQSYIVQLLDATGGNATEKKVITANIPFNFWKHNILGADQSIKNLATQIMQIVKNDAKYPFPSGKSENYLNWLVTYNQSTKTYTMNGLYFHVQPQPGFQRNLLRYYTAWGAADVYNMSSDLFVRADGTIELPAVQNASGTWQYAPIVAQTWDRSQRYTLLNQTKFQVPSTQDDYPGYEVYFPGNVYLPGKAGVVTGYVNYLVQDNTGLAHRQSDLWLGLKGDSANDVQVWDFAPVNRNLTEPGGQANKPYMLGAGNNKSGQYTFRLQASNSFCVARLAYSHLQGKLYDASFYVNLDNGLGYQKAATISYQWQPWTIGSNTANLATWHASPDSYGAGVPQLTYANTLGGQAAITANQSSWNSSGRTLPWEFGHKVDPSKLSQYGSTLGKPIWGDYIITGTASDPKTQYLIVLNPSAYFTPGLGGDWGIARNWSSGEVPDDNHNVYLQQSGTVTYNNILHTAASLSMLAVDGTTLQIHSPSPMGDFKAEMAIVGVGNQGTLSQSAGTVTLTDKLILGYEKTGNGTYTLEGGNFSASNVIVGANGRGTFSQTNGTATISGTMTLTSTGTYNISGGTMTTNIFVNNGTFHNNGGSFTYNQMSLQGGNFVGDLDNRTLLKGYGPITGKLTNSGTINPGNSPGTLTVGTYTSLPGSTQVVEIALAANYDKIITTAAGGATLNGGTLSPQLLGGYFPATNTVFHVVEATGGGTVTGSIAGIDNTRMGSSRTLFWKAVYKPTRVDLQAVGNYTPADLVLSANQRSVGNALNSLAPNTTGGDLLAVLNAINALTSDAGVAAAHTEISPAKYAALPAMAFPVTNMQFQYLQNRLARVRWEAAPGREAVSAGGSSFGQGFNFSYDSSARMMLAASNLTISDAGARYINNGVEQRWGIYVEPNSTWGSLDATANLAGYRYKNFGFTLGAEYWVLDNLLVGLNTGFSRTIGSIGGSGADLNANVIPVNAYGAYFHQGFYANVAIGYTYSGYDMQRNIAFGTISRTAQAGTSGNQFQLGAETGYEAKIGNAVVGPVLSLQYATQTVGGFTESNAGALALQVDSQTADSVQSGLGVRASYNVRVGNVAVKPHLSVTWQHEFSGNTRGLNASLAAGGSTINFQTDKIGQDFALISLDIPAKITRNLLANVGYTAEVGRNQSSNMGANIGLKLKW